MVQDARDRLVLINNFFMVHPPANNEHTDIDCTYMWHMLLASMMHRMSMHHEEPDSMMSGGDFEGQLHLMHAIKRPNN